MGDTRDESAEGLGENGAGPSDQGDGATQGGPPTDAPAEDAKTEGE